MFKLFKRALFGLVFLPFAFVGLLAAMLVEGMVFGRFLLSQIMDELT